MYSKDFRKAALDYWAKGHTAAELYEAFGIYPSRIVAWKKLLKDTGSLEPQYPKTRKRKIDLEKLEAAVEGKPDATLAELAGMFGCSSVAIFRALKKIKATLKKNSIGTANVANWK